MVRVSLPARLMAEMSALSVNVAPALAVSARSPKRRPLGAPQRTPETPSTASSPDCPRIYRRERISLVKNRMREFRQSGSVRDGDGNVLIYSAMTPTARGGKWDATTVANILKRAA